MKQKSRVTAAKIKIRRFWETYNAPSKACDKKLSVFSSNGGPPDSVARPAIKIRSSYQSSTALVSHISLTVVQVPLTKPKAEDVPVFS